MASGSKGAAGAGGGGGPIRLSEMMNMSIDQLRSIKEQTDLEVNLLQDSLTKIHTAASRLEVANAALQDLSLRPQGKKILVPLTASLYVPGYLDDADNVLVDVGTGYFVEKTMAEGNDYCERKTMLLKSNFDELLEVQSGASDLSSPARLYPHAIGPRPFFSRVSPSRGSPPRDSALT